MISEPIRFYLLLVMSLKDCFGTRYIKLDRISNRRTLCWWSPVVHLIVHFKS